LATIEVKNTMTEKEMEGGYPNSTAVGRTKQKKRLKSGGRKRRATLKRLRAKGKVFRNVHILRSKVHKGLGTGKGGGVLLERFIILGTNWPSTG
jgi:hypothetical protein